MKQIMITVVLLAWTVLGATRAQAITLRYAIVVGNNDGQDVGGHKPFPRLRHAESEARRLRERLVELANFDPSPGRTVLLTGATREQMQRAVAAIKKQMELDYKKLGEVDTLFAFFFTGHGLSGRLLFADGPMGAEEVGSLFKSVGADFNIGVFDACYSGSLENDALAHKGVELTRGLNIFRALPEEVLTAEGSIWFASSGPDQLSYEDQRLGGVFTHFFIEALRKAPVDGPGITLDDVWNYARKHTVAHTSRHGRRQVPQQFVAKLKSSGPLYFSFPVERTARLALGASVEGHFILSYAEGQLTETIEKKRGNRKEVAVYPGRTHITQVEGGKVLVRAELDFREGGRVSIHTNPDPVSWERPGRSSHRLWEKGLGDNVLTATADVPATAFLLGVTYTNTWTPGGTVSPAHLVAPTLRLDRGGFTGRLHLGYGLDTEEYESWSYRLDALVAGLSAGWSWDLGPVRLTASGGVTGARLWQQYNDGTSRATWMIQPTAMVGLLLPTSSGVAFELALSAGAARLPGAAQSDGDYWQARGGFDLAIYYQL